MTVCVPTKTRNQQFKSIIIVFYRNPCLQLDGNQTPEVLREEQTSKNRVRSRVVCANWRILHHVGHVCHASEGEPPAEQLASKWRRRSREVQPQHARLAASCLKLPRLIYHYRLIPLVSLWASHWLHDAKHSLWKKQLSTATATLELGTSNLLKFRIERWSILWTVDCGCVRGSPLQLNCAALCQCSLVPRISKASGRRRLWEIAATLGSKKGFESRSHSLP